jgi:hypothetical protein
VFGGLFKATALTLLVVPVVYELMDELRTRLRGDDEAVRVAIRPAPAASLVEHSMAGRAGAD